MKLLEELTQIINEKVDPQIQRKLDKFLIMQNASQTKSGIEALPRTIQGLPGMLELAQAKVLDKLEKEFFDAEEAGDESRADTQEKLAKSFITKNKGKVFMLSSEGLGEVNFVFIGKINKAAGTKTIETLFPAILQALEIDTANFQIKRISQFDEFFDNPDTVLEGNNSTLEVKFEA